jgi:hypothetical protein
LSPPANYSVLTQGVANQDFTAAASSTCRVQSYGTGATCTVDVIFAPKIPGLRTGPVVIYHSSGNPIETVYLQGTGTGPQVVFQPPAPTVIVNAGLFQSKNIAVDASGSIFVANGANCRVLKFSPPSYAQTASISTVVTGSCTSPTVGGAPRGVSVDGAGNVYSITSDTGTVLQATLKFGGTYNSAARILNSVTLDTPSSVVVDGLGNLFT